MRIGLCLRNRAQSPEEEQLWVKGDAPVGTSRLGQNDVSVLRTSVDMYIFDSCFCVPAWGAEGRSYSTDVPAWFYVLLQPNVGHHLFSYPPATFHVSAHGGWRRRNSSGPSQMVHADTPPGSGPESGARDDGKLVRTRALKAWIWTTSRATGAVHLALASRLSQDVGPLPPIGSGPPPGTTRTLDTQGSTWCYPCSSRADTSSPPSPELCQPPCPRNTTGPLTGRTDAITHQHGLGIREHDTYGANVSGQPTLATRPNQQTAWPVGQTHGNRYPRGDAPVPLICRTPEGQAPIGPNGQAKQRHERCASCGPTQSRAKPA